MVDPPTNQKAGFRNLEWLKTFNANLRNKVFFDSTRTAPKLFWEYKIKYLHT